jgi:mono/diheme cytochrome c family protein
MSVRMQRFEQRAVRLLPWLVGIAIVVALAFWLRSAAAFDAVTLEDYSGAELFQRFCASCHGDSAHGDGPVAASLKTVVPDLTRITQRYGEFPTAQIRETIDGRGLIRAHGTREMPVWGYEFWMEEGGDVNAEKAMRDVIKRLVDYLRQLQVDTPRNRP